MTAKTLPKRIAAAAALYEPGPLLQVQAAEDDDDRGDDSRGALRLGAVAVALLWANLVPGYAAFWHTRIALTVGPWTLGADLRTWIDEGLMTLFFLVVGLEAKRERDLGALTAGVGFTVSLLIASRAFGGALLDQAKVGILATALLAPALSAVALRRGSFRPVMAPC